jgi:hypothetical protein
MTSQAPTGPADLAERFEAEQQIDHEQALAIAEKVLTGDPRVAAAAATWSRTGVMPHEPEIEGHTPEDLYRDYFPTQVFTILLGLSKDPRLRSALRHYPKRGAWDLHGRFRY